MATFTGTTGADSIVGTAGGDVINARTSPSGGDTLFGGDGSDTISGSIGLNDAQVTSIVDGGAGDDRIAFFFDSEGGFSSVSITGGAANDAVDIVRTAPGFGPVTIDGGTGTDTLTYDLGGYSTIENTTITGFEKLVFRDFENAPSPGLVLPADLVRGVAGAISLDSAIPVRLIVLGTGAVDFTGAAQGLDVTAYTLSHLTGSSFNDSLTGLNGVAISGGDGNDTITAASAAVDGGAGDDVVTFAGQVAGTLDGGAGHDLLNLELGYSGSTVDVGAIDISSGAGILPGGLHAKGFESFGRLTIDGNSNTINAGHNANEIYVNGSSNLINASSTTTSVVAFGYYPIGGDGPVDTVHVVPAGKNETVQISSQLAGGLLDLDYSSATSGVQVRAESDGRDGQIGIHSPIAYLGESFSASTSSVSAFLSTGSAVRVEGSAFADVIAGDGGGGPFTASAEIHAGAGNDTVTAGLSSAVLDGGAGVDTLSFDIKAYLTFDAAGTYLGVGQGVATPVSTPGATVDLAVSAPQATGFGSTTITGFENVTGSTSTDAVLGDDGANAIVGLAGADTLSGRGGSDSLTGGAGADSLDGGDGIDGAFYAGFSHDYRVALTGGQGTVSGGPEGGTDTLSSIEYLQFLDGKLTFDTGSTAAQILRLYDSFLGRAPDVGGFDSYLKFFAAGHTFQDMAANAAASPEFHDATAALTDTQYITYVYEHSLRREPDPGGLQNYLDALHNGSLTRTSMIVQAAESPEHIALTAGAVAAGLWVPDEKVEGLELLYDAAVQRQPDPTGISGYTALLASGTTFKQIANQMAASAEFHAAHDGQTDAQYVDSLYVAEVGRHADAPGLAAYLNELAHGHTRGDLLYETAMSQEHQSHVLAYYDPLLIGA